VKYFENCLTLNIDGSIGNVFLRNNKFSLSEKVIPLIIKKDYEDYFDKLYLKYSVEKELMKRNFGFSNKAGKDKIRNIEIEIPIDENDNFDLKKQKEISEKYKEIDEIKRKIKIYLEEIEKVKIDVNV